MYPLGHIGVGTWIMPTRLRERLSWAWFAAGCLLPDILDKPVFLATRVAARSHPDRYGLLLEALDCSRLLGHSLFFLALLVAAALVARSEKLVAVAWGVGTHLLLDLVPDLISGSRLQWPTWLLWPVFGSDFPADAARVVISGVDFEWPLYRAGEWVGGALVVLEFVRRRARRALPQADPPRG